MIVSVSNSRQRNEDLFHGAISTIDLEPSERPIVAMSTDAVPSSGNCCGSCTAATVIRVDPPVGRCHTYRMNVRRIANRWWWPG